MSSSAAVFTRIVTDLFHRFFAFMREAGYTGDFTTEATSFDQTGKVDIDKVNKTLDKIKELAAI